ncbi:CHAT domain-containing protein [Floridanema evergladense]
MDESRVEDYLNLIQQLLNCPNGEESEILQANSDLLDLGFLQVCEGVVGQLAESGNENAADFLQNLASQLEEFFGMNEWGNGNNLEIENVLNYREFIRELLQAENSHSDVEVIYQMLAQRQHLLNARFADILQQVTENLIAEQPEAIESIISIIGNLSIHINDFPLGKKANNIEIAIKGYQIVLSNCQPGSEKWAQTQNNLGTAYSDRIRGDRADNLEQAIASYIAALQVRTREAFSEQWAITQNNLAAAYKNRIKGDRADNLEQAIASYTAVLQVYTCEAFPKQWATIQNNLGNTYKNRIRGDRADNLERAIAFYIAALQVRTHKAFPKQWATTQNNLGIAYSDRIRGDRADNLERAIASYTAALQVYTRDAFPQDWAQTQNNLGIAYRNRIREDRADNIETAIRYYTDALQVRTREAFPQQWAMTQNNLALAYSERIKGEKADNIENAIRCYTDALQVYIREAFPQDWAMTQNNLGNAYADRIKGERVDNLENAIKFYQDALKVRTREAFPQHHTETLFNLGLAYRKIPKLQLAHNTFADAIDTVELLRGEIHSGDETKQKLAERYNQIYQNMVEVCLELKNYTVAIEYAERSKARNLVELVANRDINPKSDIPETIHNELSRLRQEIYTEQRRQEIEERNRNILSAMMSESGFLNNRTHLNQLQQQLDELITRDITPIDPSFSLTQKIEPIPYREIQSLTGENTTILEWYITDDKFLTFIITPQSPTPIIWQSSTADLEKLVRWVNGYFRAYAKKKKDHWKRRLTLRLRLLAKILHLDEILKSIPKQCDRLILIPHRYLHLFPLHALPVSQETWLQFNRNSDSSPANPYLLDCFVGGVGYAPSCQLLQQAQRRQRPNFSHLFAIQNPTNDLHYTDLEVQAIAQHFNPSDILANAAAKIEALDEQRLRNAHCAHFSCHGYFNFANPLQSALLLADCRISEAPEEPESDRSLRSEDGGAIDLSKCLTLDNIFTRDFSTCRLVVLSACETGLTDFSSLSDEYIGLPSGFLVAGSPSVVSSLWAVNDLSTALLMMKFYQNLKAGLTVTLALNTAQTWLRNATKEELINQLDLNAAQRMHLRVELKKIDTNTKPFESPYHWAAFCAIGQ